MSQTPQTRHRGVCEGGSCKRITGTRCLCVLVLALAQTGSGQTGRGKLQKIVHFVLLVATALYMLIETVMKTIS